jgi:hypothetical protein
MTVRSPFPGERNEAESGWELHALYAIVMETFFKSDYIGFMHYFKGLTEIKCETNDFHGYYKMIQLAGHKLHHGINSDFEKYFSLTMVIILIYFQMVPANLKNETWYIEQRDLLEKNFEDIKAGKLADHNLLFDKFLKILTKQAERETPAMLRKSKAPTRPNEQKGGQFKPTAHSATAESESRLNDEKNQEAFENMMSAYLAKQGNALLTSPSGNTGGGHGKGQDRDKKRSSSAPPSKYQPNPASASTSQGEIYRVGVPAWVDDKLHPVDGTDFFSTLRRGEARLTGVITHDKNIFIKFQTSKTKQWRITPYIASSEPCASCKHSPKCYVQPQPCSRCGFFGHSRCLHKAN